MGATCCAERPPAHVRVHECFFPMYVVKVRDFLAMTGPAEPHDVLLEQGLLHQWQPGMFVLFVSHQWLGLAHPDPLGLQLEVLRKALRRVLQGTLTVEEDMTSMTPLARLEEHDHAARKRLPHSTLALIARGYLFVDWFAIPQITARKHGVNETRSKAAQAVQSIPAYVENSDLFLVLVPELSHADTGHRCSYTDWLSRGWCRAELWCRLLSNNADTSVIVVYSEGEAEFMFPLDWQRNLISDGRFTVESDRAAVVRLGEVALESKLETLRQKGPMSHYRFYLASRQRLLGQAEVDLEMEDFLSYFQFESMREAVLDDTGMNGLLCAVLSGNVPMLHRLVEQNADVNYALENHLQELGYYETQTLLMVAAKSHQAPEVLRALLELRADVHRRARSGISCTFVVREAGHVRELLAYRADFIEDMALNGAASRACTEVVAELLKIRCEADGRSGGKYGPLHACCLFGRGNPHAAENLMLLLEHRASLERRAVVGGMLAKEVGLARRLADRDGLATSSTLVRTWASLEGSTPLHCAALSGDSLMVNTLLQFRAEVATNTRGDLPHELAAACGHTHLVPLLETFYA